ncbi:hypothetical protein ROV80_05305 [Stenotrophomonas pavanii]|uniref:hypothetical protein n=1 Tax=Stenotrophomonas pavanii TaxID=487698 RepID=UPI002894CE83|nr:hypothetical protein [Stenotrophomonas pavanii]MDT3454660.1 hypothetical protein [Stenotrophomonas pavanii]
MDPLVSPDVDLRGMPFMPLDVARLRDSELAIMATGDEFRAAVLLWCAAWNQLPAASLPDSDQALAAYAGFGRDVRGWLGVKSGAMRGFVLCSDGRWYHPVVADKALEAWAERQEYRAGKSNEAERKKREREWRGLAFDALRGVGVTPPWNIKTGDLRKLLERHELQVSLVDARGNGSKAGGEEGSQDSADSGAPPVTNNVTRLVTVTGRGRVTAKTGTGTGTGTGISTPDTSLQASEIPEGFSATGWASVLMRRAGCHTASASHPDLIAAVEVEGVPFQMLVDLVEEGRARAPPPKSLFVWAVAAARGRHAAGAKPVNSSNGSNHGTRRLSPAERTAQLALEGELADAAAATFAGTGHGYADALGADG